MKGWPLLEGVIAGILLLLVALPVSKLTRGGSVAYEVPIVQDETEDHAHDEPVEGYVYVRSSHPLVSLTLLQAGEVIATIEGDDEAELAWMSDHGRTELEVRAEWEPGADDAYCELEFEPDGAVSKRVGFWGRGSITRRLEVEWPHHH